MMRTGSKAFTLIELMIVVAIVGILASIGFPSYTRYVQNTKESEAQTALVSFASVMSQYYLEGMTYLGAAGTQLVPLNTGDPWVFSTKVPVDGGSTTYNLTINAATQTTFTLKATPVSGSGLSTYCIDELGTKDDCNGNSNW